jgi:hypothetical protein
MSQTTDLSAFSGLVVLVGAGKMGGALLGRLAAARP